MTRFTLHDVTARATSAAGSMDLGVKAATVTLDDSWSPYIQGTLVCSLPADFDGPILDPRLDGRLSIQFAERVGASDPISAFDDLWGSGTLADIDAYWPVDVVTLADIDALYFRPWNSDTTAGSHLHLDVGIRAREATHETQELTIDFASDEALLDDFALMSTTSETAGSNSVKVAALYALSKIGATLDAGATDATVDEADSLVWFPGTSGWDYIAALTQNAGLRLWCDEARIWRLSPRDAIDVDKPTVSLTEFTAANDRVSRDADWYDGVIITYEWTDDAGVRHLRRDIAGGTGSSRVLRIDLTTPYPGKGAAQRVLDRATRRGRQLSVEAVSSYTVSPSDPLTTFPPGTAAQTGVVERVQFTWPEDRMRIVSRGLVDTDLSAWLMIPEGETWLDQPTGESWVDETIGF